MKYNGFEVLNGTKKIIISASHAVNQTRNNRIKFAEPETAIIAKKLNELGYPAIIKTKNLNDDANWDLPHPYKQELLNICKANNIEFVLDLHQLSDKREMDFCLGTGNEQNRNLIQHTIIADLVKQCATENGFDMQINNPFAASSERTISGFCLKNKMPSMQLEINSKLVSKHCNGTQFDDVLEFIKKVCEIIEEQI